MKTKCNSKDSCYCGSGLAYEECCYKKLLARDSSKEKELIIINVTGEFFIPVRLYYEVYDELKLIEAFQKLKCVSWNDADLKKATINYEKEAENIGLVKYDKIPKGLTVPLAECQIRNTEMLVDLASFERAARMIEFIDRHLKRDVAKVKYVGRYNKFFTITEGQEISEHTNLDYDQIFRDDKMTVVGVEKNEEHAKEFSKRLMNNSKTDVKGNGLKEVPLIEKFPVYFYESGICSFEIGNRLRLLVINARYHGNDSFTVRDAIGVLFKGYPGAVGISSKGELCLRHPKFWVKNRHKKRKKASMGKR